jgi:isopentenyl diphosphate isomerase/L-lactate dehydrogenase-like FMN-dependent dehydrogenase
MTMHAKTSRRALLKAMGSLPLLGGVARLAPAYDLSSASPSSSGFKLPKLEDVLSVEEFEPLARAVLPPAHYGYLATGTEDDRTVAWNHEAFRTLEIRAHRFADVSKLNTGVEVFGEHWPLPLYLSAVSSQRAFHPEAEVAMARAAASRNVQVMLSNFSSSPLDQVIGARGAPIWHQLYPTDDWNVTSAVVGIAEQAGCRAIAVTIDNHWGRFNETLERAKRRDTRVCTQCHINNSHDSVRRAPIFNGVDVSHVTLSTMPDVMGPQYLEKLRKLVKVKLIIKGIVTGEDAETCLRQGADAVVVSNHGGRDEESLRSTIECLPEVVDACKGKVPVLIDGGIRRGSDVFKALALGATAVGIGRPQIWGLAPYGQAGVEAVLDIYARELRLLMRQAGTPNINSITRYFVETREAALRFAPR